MAQSNNNNINNNNSNNNNISKNITASDCSITSKDRIKISRDYKKIKCLDTLAEKYKCTIDQIEKIIKGKKKKARPIRTIKENSHLISLLDKVVYEWFQRAQRRIETGTITEEMFLQKAQETKQIFGIPNFVTDCEWVWNFRKKYNITNLDMTMLRIENGNRLLSMDINDIVMFVLKNNPITENSSSNNQQDNTTESILPMSQKNQNPTQFLCYNNSVDETIVPDNCDKTAEFKLEVLPVITNNEEAKRHLKPLEDYVLLKENFRAIGLISQLEEIFRTETTNST